MSDFNNLEYLEALLKRAKDAAPDGDLYNVAEDLTAAVEHMRDAKQAALTLRAAGYATVVISVPEKCSLDALRAAVGDCAAAQGYTLVHEDRKWLSWFLRPRLPAGGTA